MKHILLLLALFLISPAHAQESARPDPASAAKEIAHVKKQKVEQEFARCIAGSPEESCERLLRVFHRYEQDALARIRQHGTANMAQANIDMLACYQSVYYSEYVNCLARVASQYKSAGAAPAPDKPAAMDKPLGYDSLATEGQ